MIVADTNLLAYLLVPGEFTDSAEAVRLADPEWIAPSLWRSEFCNVVSLYVRFRGMSEPDAIEVIEAAERIMGAHECTVSSPTILRAALRFNIAAYDAEFVALAEERGLRLVTNDRVLLQRTPTISILPDDFLKQL
ncbi:MAG: type II toxin-antitoxin system VapC family toxin [Pirellulaceae bacterium]|nr:type II toxin-antitoxin system VapC family toxin [Pirellulaceae bacterium]